VSRWFEHGGAPYTFRLYVAVAPLAEWSGANFTRLVRVAVNNKALRSFLSRIVVTRRLPPTPVYVGAAVVTRVCSRLILTPVTAIRAPRSSVYVGAAIVTRVRSRIVLPSVGTA